MIAHTHRQWMERQATTGQAAMNNTENSPGGSQRCLSKKIVPWEGKDTSFCTQMTRVNNKTFRCHRKRIICDAVASPVGKVRRERM